MKIKRSLIGMCLVGVTLISAVPSYAAMSDTVKLPRVPEKTIYTGTIDVYSDECIANGFWCHDFECPVIRQEAAPDYRILKDGSFLGDKPSYEKNSKELDVKFFLENQLPFTLPVGKIKLNDIIGKDVFGDVSIDVKEGVNKYKINVNGVDVETAPVKGINMSRKVGSYSDLKKTHWAYANIVKAIQNGWIETDSPTKVGMEVYENIKSPATGIATKQRTDFVTMQEIFTGINRVLMSNGVYLGDNLSRTDLEEVFKIDSSFATSEELNNLFNLSNKYGKYADWLNVGLSASLAGYEDYTAINIYDNIGAIDKLDTFQVDRNELSMLLHNIIYDMNLPVVNKMEGPEYTYYDDTFTRNNYIVGAAGYRTGSTHYVISRGLISPEKVNGKYVGFSGEPIGKPELATILCNLDRAIKASKTVK